MPVLVIVAGPNGSGKSHLYEWSLKDKLPPGHVYLNNDNIARASGLGHLKSARQFFVELNEAISARRDVVVETTLSWRALKRRIDGYRSAGYRVVLYFLALSSADDAIARVESRVGNGGHDVPGGHATIRRRYRIGARSFFGTFRVAVDAWIVVDTSAVGGHEVLAVGAGDDINILDPGGWARFWEAGHA